MTVNADQIRTVAILAVAFLAAILASLAARVIYLLDKLKTSSTGKPKP
jgi:hypothetical protein